MKRNASLLFLLLLLSLGIPWLARANAPYSPQAVTHQFYALNMSSGESGAGWRVTTCGSDFDTAPYHAVPGLRQTFTVDRESTVELNFAGLGRNSKDYGAIYVAFFVDGEVIQNAFGHEQLGGRRQGQANNNIIWHSLANMATVTVAAGSHTVEVKTKCDLSGEGWVWNGWFNVGVYPAAAPYNTAWLTDAILTGSYNTSTETLRYFLKQQGSCLADPIQDVDGTTIDISALIHDAATTYRINPKVILATMQKEQSAITRCPETWRLKRLMGVGHVSTARQQIDAGTALLRAYQDELNSDGQTRSGWQVGVAKQTQDGVWVTPATKAVAGQFTYTPYVGTNWGGNDTSVGGVWRFWDAWYNRFHFDRPLPTPPPPPCALPFFSQQDSRWRDHPLRTAGACSPSCNTIGRCGCTLTSAAMLFKHYGATLTPATLSDCMDTYACPFYWYTGAACSGGKAQWVNRYSFSWERLAHEINQNKRPVLVEMSRDIGGAKHTHWVVVFKGSGNQARNYAINDPWPLNGAGMRLNAYNAWTLHSMVVYTGTPRCQITAAAARPPAELPPQSISTPANHGQKVPLTVSEARSLVASAVVSGSAWLYRMTEMTMTVQLIGASTADNVTEMVIWTDAMTETTWQPFATFAVLPRSDEIHVRFSDASGNISPEVMATSYPDASPAAMPFEVCLPLVLRSGR